MSTSTSCGMNLPWYGCRRWTCFVRTFSGKARSDHESSRSSVAYSSSCVTATKQGLRRPAEKPWDLFRQPAVLVARPARNSRRLVRRLGVRRLHRDPGAVLLGDRIGRIDERPRPRCPSAHRPRARSTARRPRRRSHGRRRRGQWKRSQRFSGRSSPLTISTHSPATTRKSSCASSRWYIVIGSPGARTLMLIPSCGKREVLALEARVLAELAVEPAGVLRVEDEPALPLGRRARPPPPARASPPSCADPRVP